MKAPCSYFRKCSGCTKLSFPYAKQVHDKERRVRETLAGFVGGRDDVQVFAPLVQSPLALGYRSSTKLCLDMDAFGQRRIGLYERGSKTVVDIPRCPVHHPEINRLVGGLLGGRTPLPAPFYNHAKRGFQGGCLKFVTVRAVPATGEMGVVLSHTGVQRDALSAWLAGLDLRRLSVYESRLAKDDDDRILSEATSHVAGLTHVRYVVAGREFRLTPLAFFQANHSLTDAFAQHVAGGLRGEGLLDLYGGFGAYAFLAAPGFAKTHLVDGNAAAIAAASAANAAAQLKGLVPVHASVEDFLAKGLRPADAKAVTHVIVNPPRAGLSPAVKARLTSKALPALAGLTYVSCNLETLARDLGELTRQSRLGIREIRAFDMFPQTDHIEVVVKLAAP